MISKGTALYIVVTLHLYRPYVISLIVVSKTANVTPFTTGDLIIVGVSPRKKPLTPASFHNCLAQSTAPAYFLAAVPACEGSPSVCSRLLITSRGYILL